MGPNLRVITLNLWGTEPPLSQRLDLALRQLRALAPDVVCLQEVRPLDGKAGRTTADVIAKGAQGHRRQPTDGAGPGAALRVQAEES